MNPKDIADQVIVKYPGAEEWVFTDEELIEFASRIAAAERAKIQELCTETANQYMTSWDESRDEHYKSAWCAVEDIREQIQWRNKNDSFNS